MATIKKISGLSSVDTPGSADKLLVEDSSGNLKYTTVGGVRTGKADLTNNSQTITANKFTTSSTYDKGTIEINPWAISATDSSNGTRTNYFHVDFGWIGPITKTLQINDSSDTHSGNKVSLMDGTVDHVLNLPSTIEADIVGNVSGSSGSCTGDAATATKLGTTSVGSSVTPIYLDGGTPTSTGYTFETSLSPSNNTTKIPTSSAVVAELNKKAALTANAYTTLGSFTATNGAHTVTNVSGYRWLVFSMSSVGMIGVIDRYLLRNVYNVSENCFYITSDESWCALYMPSNTKVRIASTNQSTATMTVYGVR